MAESSGADFHITDYIIFILFLCASLAIGIYSAYAKKRPRNTEEYFHGNRELSLVLVTTSFVASMLSAITVLGEPAEIYYYGLHFALTPCCVIIACLTITFSFVPLLHPLKVTSMFEYLELRFESRNTRLVGTTINLIAEIAWSGVAIFAPALCLQAVLGIPEWISMILIATLSTIYTSVGGIRAVIWTDALQGVIMLGTLLLVNIMGIIKLDGIPAIVNQLRRGKLLEMDVDPDPTKRISIWAILVGQTFFFLALFTSQASVQRMASLPTMKKAKWMYLLSIIGKLAFTVVATGAGCAAYAYYQSRLCDPLAAGYITNYNQILPYFVAEIMPYPGVNGLFIACIFSAALSTVSSIQNSAAAILWEDFFKWKFDNLKLGTKMLIFKAFVVLTGIMSVVIGFFAKAFGGTLIQISAAIIGAAMGPRFAMFVLGGTFPFVGSKSCSVSAIIGASVCIMFSVLNMLDPVEWPHLPTSTANCSLSEYSWTTVPSFQDNTSLETSTSSLYEPTQTLGFNTSDNNPARRFYHLSNFYYSLLGFLATIVSALLFSLVPGCRTDKPVNPKYLFSCCRRYGSRYIQDITVARKEDKDSELMLSNGKDSLEDRRTHLTDNL